jgi:hypothetical protein
MAELILEWFRTLSTRIRRIDVLETHLAVVDCLAAGEPAAAALAGFDSLVADAQLNDVAEIDAEKAYTTALINFVGTCDSVDVRSVLSAMSVMWRQVIADYQVTPADYQVAPPDHQIAPPDHQV